ncbi:WecB/TagA/CpsF family glycosyltransferase [Cytobacillus purgationiresistens]|uniref:N-acetylglucosaminyldiphosphoundecaprenol N-acetyl-beta-D-mannosaminyltransferase n=1 Tax=Cytobacillus purgationiresistens TaxID=863449 RepID=A0ABU0ACY9_9BACI|nr:WecB/TagA/CpsF family glycosyltransferase [Cytobacillus purgationiresistens]MDQ0269109.1 N-acetylglucosaminyldiphosphoundecaprenol N-acetyl-beta-D-mannosaminyltransferase [Cytobacillus purgationiresistens]
MNKHVEILDISFINTSFSDMEEKIANHINKGEKSFVVTANPEIVMHAKEDADYKGYVQSADYVVPDGNGILLAANMLKQPLKERITGYDLTISLLQKANAKGWNVYLLGGREEVNKRAADRMKADYPLMNLVGRHDGYFDWNDSVLKEEIASLNPDLILVALGFPRQEKWIAENIASFSKGVFIGVGGSIDVIAGEVKRAPQFWQRLKLEWFYRLLKQPSRWKRMMALPKFVIEVMKTK